MNEQAPTIRTESAPALDFSDPKLIATLKQTVAAGATDAEFAMFVENCRATGLNPFKKEIWFIKGKGYTKNDGTEVEGKVQMMTGINGFYSVANTNPMFDGIELIESEEQVTITEAIQTNWKGETSIRKLTPSIVAPAWIEARVWRKDRKYPSVARAKWSEYAKELLTAKGLRTIWATMPSVMLAKCAESMALRKAFPQQLNGFYTQEEMPSNFAATIDEPEQIAAPAAEPERKPAPTPTPPITGEGPEFEATDDAIKEGVAFQYNTKLWGDQFQNPAERNSKWNAVRVKYGIRKQGTTAFCAVAIPGWEMFVIFDPTEGADADPAADEVASDDDLPGEWSVQPVKAAAQVEIVPADQLEAVKSRVRRNKQAQQQQEG